MIRLPRSVRRKVSEFNGEEKGYSFICWQVYEECTCFEKGSTVEWTEMSDDTVIQLFTLLNNQDKASLSSTCKSWRDLGSTPCLWKSLDIRFHKFDAEVAASLVSRCANLERIRFSGAESADYISNLQAKSLLGISGHCCGDLTDATLSMLVARHERLESLQLGPEFCVRISSDAIRAVALCCPKLKKLWLSGVLEVDGNAINSLAKHCKQLTEIGFVDCLSVDEVALGNVVSVRFISVAGTRNIQWDSASQMWSKLPNLIGVDVSRTDIGSSYVPSLFRSCQTLKILCGLNCPNIEQEGNPVAYNFKGKVLLTLSNDICKGVASLFADITKNEKNVFSDWRNSKAGDKHLNEIMAWLEWILSHSLLRIAECSSQGMDSFWLKHGASLLLSLMQSSQEDVQERAAAGLASFVVIDDEDATIDCRRAEAVRQNGGIRLLIDRARSCREGLQYEATKAIATLSVNAKVAKAVAGGGGIKILVNLARSTNRSIAEEAAGGLWNLSVGEEHKVAIAVAGGVQALVDLICKWPCTGGGVLERAAGALANLAADDKCSIDVADAGGVSVLVNLARTCKNEAVQEQAARALGNMAAHGASNSNNAVIGQERGALEALVVLTYSPCDGVRQEAAGALWNLTFHERNREAIAAVRGVEALVSLANYCLNASDSLQERVAGALWGLAVSEANSIAVGREGGVAPLVRLAQSPSIEVHETAVGALWNLAFNPRNALRIVEEGGVAALVNLCAYSVSKTAPFMAVLALTYIFDGRMDEVAHVGSADIIPKSVSLDDARKLALEHIDTFVLKYSDQQALSAAAASSTPTTITQVAEAARLQEAGQLRCSGAEIGRFVTMLRNSCCILQICAAFALVQFTFPNGRYAKYHADLLQTSGAARTLRATAAASALPMEVKIFIRIVLRNLAHHNGESSSSSSSCSCSCSSSCSASSSSSSSCSCSSSSSSSCSCSSS